MFTLLISAVTLKISCEESVILEHDDFAYQDFLDNKSEPNRPNITISLLLQSMHEINAFEKIFDSAQSWSMFKIDNEYSITYHSPVVQKPFWIARINNDFTKIAVYCGDDFIKNRDNKTIMSNPVRYPLDQIIIMYYLAQRKGIITHSAGMQISGNGYIFAGRSESGKSTISRQFKSQNKYELLSDDRIIIRKMNDTFQAYGTPWPGDAQIAKNKSTKLKGIFYLSQSAENRIEKISPQEAAEKLMPVVSIPWYDKEVVPHILDFCDELVSSIPAYVLHFKPGNEVIDVFEKFVSN